jgi:hypothetical protein
LGGCLPANAVYPKFRQSGPKQAGNHYYFKIILVKQGIDPSAAGNIR